MLLRFFLRRATLLLPLILGITLIVFVLIYISPGDPILILLGSNYDEEVAAKLRHELGLDRSPMMQYFIWLARVSRGELGRSFHSQEPVLELVLKRTPGTIILSFGSMLVALAIAIPTGVLSATRRNSLTDHITRILAMLGVSIPVYWLGILLMILFSLKLRLLPAGGSVEEYGWKAVVLPSVTLGLSFAPLIARMLRSSMLDVLSQDYIRTAMAKGLTLKDVHYKHALKNALIPTVTVVGMQFGMLLGGAVLTETIFSLPGLGKLLVDSILARDYQVVQGCVLWISLIFVGVNVLVDVIYLFLDPRIRY